MQEEIERRTVGEWLIEWLETRNYLRLLAALPALLALVSLGAFAVSHFGWTPARAVANTVEAGQNAYAAGDYERARLAYLGLIHLSGRREPEYTYKIALSLARTGRKEEAATLLAALAPPDRAGYAPAHLFLAKTLLEAGRGGPQVLRVAEAHLLNVLRAEPQNDEVRYLLGQLSANLGQWSEARKYLSDAVSAHPEAALLLATAHQATGDTTAARAWAERAAKYFSARVAAAVGDDLLSRVAWAKALVLLKDYPAAFAILEAGYKKASNPDYKSCLAQLCAEWVGSLDKDNARDLGERLRVIQVGLQYAPQNESLLRALAAMSGLEGTAAEAAQQSVNRMLAAGQNVALLHFCLGGLAWQRGDLDKARYHYQAAYASDPTAPNVANNLAAALMTGDKPEYPLALAIIQPLVEKFPRNPNYRDTRGQILVALGREQEAVPDLEFALPKLPDPLSTHKALAQAYRKLGFADLAAEHERLARAGPGPADKTGAPPGDATGGGE